MNAEVEQTQSSTPMSFREVVWRVVHLVKRTLLYWPVFVAAGTVAIAAFFLTPLAIPPVYESSAVLLYREVIRADAAVGASAGATETKRARNARLRESALSRATLLSIIAKNGLYRSTVESRGEIEAVETMRRATRFVVAESDAITIYFRGDSPQQAVSVVRDLVASTTEQVRKYSMEQSQTTVAFLEAQLASSSKELSKAEQNIAEFLSAHPEFALESAAQVSQMGTAIRAEAREQATTRASDPLDALNRQAARLQRRIQDASRPQSPVIGPPPLAIVETPPTVAEAERNLKRAQETLAERLSHYTDKHPDVVTARVQVRIAEQRLVAARDASISPPKSPPAAQISSTAASAGSTDNAALDRLKAELAQVQRMIISARSAAAGGRKEIEANDSAEGEGSGIVAIETEWASLSREVVSARDRNDQIQKQLFKASLLAKVQTSGGGGQITIIDEPYEPMRPITRGKKTTGAAGAALFMVLGLLVAFALALTDDRLYGRYDLKLHGIGPIGHVVPSVAKRVREA